MKKRDILLKGISLRLEHFEGFLKAKSSRGNDIGTFNSYEQKFNVKTQNKKGPKGPKLHFNTSTRLERPSDFTSCSNKVQTEGNFKEYLNFLLLNGEFDLHLLIMAEIYTKRAVDCPKASKFLKPQSIKIFYGICILLAHKFSVEDAFWPLEEYCKLLGISQETLRQFETFIVCEVMGFELHIGEEELRKERAILGKY